MKIFKLVGTYDWPINKKYKDYVVLLGGSDTATKHDFQKNCRLIINELKEKYDADNLKLPLKECRGREEIINEIAEKLCQRFGFAILKIEGVHKIGGFPLK